MKTVYSHTEWQSAPITPSVLAGKLGVAPSSVTEMVKKLAASGLVSHVPYGAVRLTPEGEKRALAMLRRHRLIETWLVQEFDYAWDEVHDEAEVLEHTISDRLLSRIDERLGSPRFDPHGDAIPDAAGHVDREPFVLLADAAPGHAGRVLRVSDRDPELLRGLEALGVRVGSRLRVTADGVELEGSALTLPAGADQIVWVSRDADGDDDE
ncbi:metal-dependent transcriptional regulator [Microbacterium sp. NIBRBAC000506063]|nr:metal-dependent transcriptional regulator [Microbacterium sp. NIBRBAC000506063]